MKKILIVGCGNIGSRHLQAVLRFTESFDIQIVEPNSSSIETAKIRLNEISSSKLHNISWHNSLSSTESSDLCIVSTPSMQRSNILSSLLKKGNTRFLIEKIVCRSQSEYVSLLKDFEQYNAKGWVNTTRRYFEIYQQIKKKFEGTLFTMNVNAGNSSLGSNSIHFIDLFSWFNNDYKIKLNGQYLIDQIGKHKKYSDLLEFFGTITSSATNNSFLNISFLPFDKLPIVVTFQNEKNHIIINETDRTVTFLKNGDNLELKANQLYTSEFMTDVFSDILETNNCNLPTLHQSFNAHCELFRIFNSHIEKILNKKVELCPIS